MNSLRNIINAAGGPSCFARKLGFKTHSAVLKWKKIPAERVVEIEEITGIPRERLRPDLYRIDEYESTKK